jgi:hypothetical protein
VLQYPRRNSTRATVPPSRTAHPPPVLFTRYSPLAAAGSLPRAVTMLDDIEAAALRVRLQAARLLEEEFKAAALE